MFLAARGRRDTNCIPTVHAYNEDVEGAHGRGIAARGKGETLAVRGPCRLRAGAVFWSCDLAQSGAIGVDDEDVIRGEGEFPVDGPLRMRLAMRL